MDTYYYYYCYFTIKLEARGIPCSTRVADPYWVTHTCPTNIIGRPTAVLGDDLYHDEDSRLARHPLHRSWYRPLVRFLPHRYRYPREDALIL